MNTTYTTRQGDTFERIAWEQYGNSNAMGELIRANREFVETAIFDSGTVLKLPEIEPKEEVSESTPPWRR